MKKWLAILLAVLLALSTAAVAFADDDAEAIGVSQDISFDTNTAEWGEFGYVGFHIWNVSGDEEFKPLGWNSKKERGTDADKDGIWTFDFAKVNLTLKEGAQYAVVFYNDKGAQTYNLLFDTNCLGDTAYCDPSAIYENPEDSGKTAAPAYWRHQDPSVNGPQLCVSSIGSVQGSCIPRGVTHVDLFIQFLRNTLDNARIFSGLSDQELIDGVGGDLGLDADTVQYAITEFGKEVNWSYDASVLNKYPITPTEGGTESGNPAPFNTDVQVASGKGAVLCSAQGYYTFEWLKLTAVPEEGYEFAGWEIEGEYSFVNNETVSDPEVTISVKSDLVVKANFAPVQVSKVLGDSDGDGKVTIIDATRIQRFMAKLVTEDQINLAVSDTDRDGKVTILDATRIQRVLANLCDWDGSPVVNPEEPTTDEYEGTIAK